MAGGAAGLTEISRETPWQLIDVLSGPSSVLSEIKTLWFRSRDAATDVRTPGCCCNQCRHYGLEKRCQDTSDPRHFGPKTFRHWCRSVRTLRYQCWNVLGPKCVVCSMWYDYRLSYRPSMAVMYSPESYQFVASFQSFITQNDTFQTSEIMLSCL